MNKVGIITMYYNSVNYGGVLQAYALTNVLNDLGADSHQITYDFWKKKSLSLRNRLIEPIRRLYLSTTLKKRYLSFEEFRNRIPHTDIIYSDSNLSDTNSSFDIFITGSDQVWNLDAYREAFFLTFTQKKKLSYGAGMGQSSSSLNHKKMQQLLQGFTAISVREEEAKQLLQDCTALDIEVVADPTLLLDKMEWDRLVTKEFSEEFVFCYFLGNDKNIRNIAKKFANNRGLPIYSIPHVARFMKEDLWFGDKKIYDASPQDFIALIKNAKYVFTDSFHCCVFASIYHKQYFVFERRGKKGMSTRIKAITDLFNMESRFCYEGRADIRYIESVGNMTYDDTKLEALKSKSLSYLKKNCI